MDPLERGKVIQHEREDKEIRPTKYASGPNAPTPGRRATAALTSSKVAINTRRL